MRKKFIAILLIALCVFAASACSGNGGQSETPAEEAPAEGAETTGEDTEATAEDAGDKKVLAMCWDANDENLKKLADGLEAEARALGMDVIRTNAQNSSEKQVSDIESLIEQKPDVMFLSAVDVEAGKNLVKMSKDAGIPVMEMRGVQSDLIDCNVLGIDEDAIARVQGGYLEDLLNEDSSLELKIGYILGDPAQAEQLKRINGVNALVESNDRAELVIEKYGNWRTDQAMSIMEDWMQAYPELNCIATASDEMAAGVISALKSADKLDGFTVISIDGTENGRKFVGDGELDATVLMNLAALTKAQADVAFKLANGEEVAKDLIIGEEGAFLVTKDTLEEANKIAL
jgi:ABC-type sugar transport system substrate-binding protein